MKKKCRKTTCKKRVRFWVIMAFIQSVVLAIFLPTLIKDPINQAQLITTEITIQSLHRDVVSKNSKHLLISDGATTYRVPTRHSSNEAGTGPMKDKLSDGDRITLTYYQTSRWGQAENYVVGAYTETEVFRMVDEYYRSVKNGLIITWVLFSVLECCLAAVVVLRMTIFKWW